MVQGQRALHFLRYRAPGRETGKAHRGRAGRRFSCRGALSTSCTLPTNGSRTKSAAFSAIPCARKRNRESASWTCRATIFVPRRIKYELHASHEWFKDKERCIFCDTVRQEEKQGKRIVDVQGEYYALCPYASRVPYEVWVMHRRHNHLFEQPKAGSNRRQLAALLGRVLRRLEKVAPAYHLVVHTSPNTKNKKGELAGYWKTLPDDYHWHIEILPIVEKTSKSYSIKEVYFNSELPEQAAANLRALDPNS